MLVLSRKESESIQIGDDIVITVVDIEPTRIRLGISAPSDIRVLRTELLTRQPPQQESDPGEQARIALDETSALSEGKDPAGTPTQP